MTPPVLHSPAGGGPAQAGTGVGANGCPACVRLERRVESLGRLRFELQKQVGHLEAKARSAEARAADLERRTAQGRGERLQEGHTE